MEGDVFHKTKAGTPQGGVISPLLANIALYELEYETKKALLENLLQHTMDYCKECGICVAECPCGAMKMTLDE